MTQKGLDPKFVQYAIDHVNDDHRKEMIEIVQKLCKAGWVEDAELLSYDHNKMTVQGNSATKQKSQLFKILFSKPLTDAKAFRPELIAILEKARNLTSI